MGKIRDKQRGGAIYLTNDVVAWEIPPGRIARFYLGGMYLSPPAWKVTDAILNWPMGKCGELRRYGFDNC